MNAPAGAILAGGRATRFGGAPKGLLDVAGERMVDRVLRALEPVAHPIMLVARVEEAAMWLPDVPLVRDILKPTGTGAGIHAALRHAREPVVVVAWDLPFVPRALLAALAARGAVGDVDAVVPPGRGAHRYEPVCGWYASPCAEAIEDAWRTGDRSMHAVLDGLRTAVLSAEDMAQWGAPERLLMNVNTAEDLARANAVAAEGAR